MTTTKTRAVAAAEQFRLADRLERKRPIDFSEAALNPLHAELARAEGERLLAAPVKLTGRATTELVSTPGPEEHLTQGRMELIETLDNPNTINVAASEQRAELATRAGVLSSAIDAAVSAQAEGPIEKMLCHELAGAHAAGMGLLARLEEGRLPIADAARLTNAAARLFEVFQGGVLTLQKLKSGGTQRVVVQYQQAVNVESGGQAMVASKLVRGSRKRGRPRK